mgnify:FL=1
MIYVAFDSNTFIGKAIKFFTRSTLSHIAILTDDKLIEPWGNLFDIHWRFSKFSYHKNSTAYIYELKLSEEQESLAKRFYTWLAESEMPYNYFGVIGFIIPAFISNGGYFCSEGAWDGLKFAGIKNEAKGYQVNPEIFVSLIQGLGAKLIGVKHL